MTTDSKEASIVSSGLSSTRNAVSECVATIVSTRKRALGESTEIIWADVLLAIGIIQDELKEIEKDKLIKEMFPSPPV